MSSIEVDQATGEQVYLPLSTILEYLASESTFPCDSRQLTNLTEKHNRGV